MDKLTHISQLVNLYTDSQKLNDGIYKNNFLLDIKIIFSTIESYKKILLIMSKDLYTQRSPAHTGCSKLDTYIPQQNIKNYWCVCVCVISDDYIMM